MTDRTHYVHCPTCGKKVEWSDESKWRPFCSKRCKLIDLGDWLAEKNRVEGEEGMPEENSERHN